MNIIYQSIINFVPTYILRYENKKRVKYQLFVDGDLKNENYISVDADEKQSYFSIVFNMLVSLLQSTKQDTPFYYALQNLIQNKKQILNNLK